MPTKHDEQYNQYMREVQSYLKQVRNGRRVPASDPTDPRFSQAADDERQAKRAGLGKYIQQGPPAPAFSQVAPPPTGSITTAAPPPGRMNSGNTWYNRLGFGKMLDNTNQLLYPEAGMHYRDQLESGQNPPLNSSGGNGIMDWLDQKRGQLTKLGSNRAAAPSPVWGFHEPTHTMAEGIAPLAGAAGDVMADPRNAWMGLGPMAAMRFGRIPALGRDTGGFHVPTSQMRKQDTEMGVYPHQYEADTRNDYLFGRTLENQKADTLLQGRTADPEKYQRVQDTYGIMTPHSQDNISKTMAGRQNLDEEMVRQSNPDTGGGVPTDEMLRRFRLGR